MTGWDLQSFSLLTFFFLVAYGVCRYGRPHELTFNDKARTGRLHVCQHINSTQISLIYSIRPACLHRVRKRFSFAPSSPSTFHELKYHDSLAKANIWFWSFVSIFIQENIIISQKLADRNIFSSLSSQNCSSEYQVYHGGAVSERTRFANRRSRVTDTLAEKRGFKIFTFFGEALTVYFSTFNLSQLQEHISSQPAMNVHSHS